MTVKGAKTAEGTPKIPAPAPFPEHGSCGKGAALLARTPESKRGRRPCLRHCNASERNGYHFLVKKS